MRLCWVSTFGANLTCQSRAWVKLRVGLRAMDLDFQFKANTDASWALLLGGGYWFASVVFSF